MLHAGHRLSKDIDAFITDPQYLSILSPRLEGEDIWACDTYAEAANHLKLVHPEGEIDFIVATSVTDLVPAPIAIGDEGALPAINGFKSRSSIQSRLRSRNLYTVAVC